ncbi:hypothetical protein CLOM_g3896 [Closterium sp. NIES-68]|nr:hypothetical protein CLOM_g3896 [Closterium sp. NIES-68]GJP66815.1 hypothetical protein CLOP_g23712 [Closterium sp. NIES-67]
MTRYKQRQWRVEAGTASCWQCGHGTSDDCLSPTLLSALTGLTVTAIAAGLWHSLAIALPAGSIGGGGGGGVDSAADMELEGGDVYSWGGNQFGQLGTGDTAAKVLPTLLDCPSLDTRAVKAISCGARHSAAVTTDGTLFVWGSNKFGQLGIGHKDDAYSPQMVAKDKFDINGCGDNESAGDKKLEHAREVFVQDAKCGWWHTLAITRGTVKSLNNG